MTDRPAAWLVEALDLIPHGRPVLDVACGRGRHALYLARAGWVVHAIDRDPTALGLVATSAAQEGLAVTTEAVDLETNGSVWLGDRCYGAVIVFNYLHRPLLPAIVQAVERGGVLVYETFTAGQARRGHPRSPAFLLNDGELPGLVRPLEILRAREGDFDGKLVASIVAVRR